MRKQTDYRATLRRATKRTATAAAVAVVMVIGLPQLATPAQATNWGSSVCIGAPVNCISLGNNNQHAWRWEGDQDIPGIAANTEHAVDNQYNPTDLVAYDDAADPLPDVRAWDEPYGLTGFVGWVECPTNNTGTGGTHPNKWCRGQILRFNASYPGWFDTLAEARGVTCHEFGHTLGLRHSATADTCMFSPPILTTLNNHDRAHLNLQY